MQCVQLGHEAKLQMIEALSWPFLFLPTSSVQAAQETPSCTAEASFADHATQGGEAQGQRSERRPHGGGA